MKILPNLLVLLAALFASTAVPAMAQTIGVELLGSPTAPIIVVPGQPIDRFYPNVFDPTHPKKLTFEGKFVNDDPANRPGDVVMWFDWFDLTGAPMTSPPMTYAVIPGTPTVLGGATAPMWTIPFCPQQVSIHFEALGPGAPIAIDGIFTHECLIPEPGGLALAACGLVLAARRRNAT